MEKIVYSDYHTLSVETARFIANLVKKKPDSLLCFPSGDTSLGTFKELITMVKNESVDFSRCKFVGLDEWFNLGSSKEENCFSFLKKHFFDPIGIEQKQICFFNGESDNIEAECSRIDEYIQNNNGIDIMLLGAGMNGHLGLNEPGVSFDLRSHVVDLDETTKRVGQKYFSEHTNIEKGITLGMIHVKESKTVILQISGKKKKPVVQRLLTEEVSPQFPATFIKLHSNSYLLLDNEAYGV